MCVLWLHGHRKPGDEYNEQGTEETLPQARSSRLAAHTVQPQSLLVRVFCLTPRSIHIIVNVDQPSTECLLGRERVRGALFELRRVMRPALWAWQNMLQGIEEGLVLLFLNTRGCHGVGEADGVKKGPAMFSPDSDVVSS